MRISCDHNGLVRVRVSVLEHPDCRMPRETESFALPKWATRRHVLELDDDSSERRPTWPKLEL
jgi:hypothetical protein